jgi:hypothetical protein
MRLGTPPRAVARIWSGLGLISTTRFTLENLTTEHNLAFAWVLITLTYVASWELKKAKALGPHHCVGQASTILDIFQAPLNWSTSLMDR